MTRVSKVSTLVTIACVQLFTFAQTKTSPTSGELTGRVLDDADDSPIGGASVKAVRTDGKMLAHTVSEANGKYKIENLPIGLKLTVTYAKDPIYSSDQHEIIVSATQDGRIVLLQGDQAYYEKMAAKIRAKAVSVAVSERTEVWQSEWRAVAQSPVRPAAKAWIARALLPNAPESLKKVPLFAAYASEDLNFLKAVENRPSSGEILANNVSPLIIDNMITTQGRQQRALDHN
jgi:hypothetical protein